MFARGASISLCFTFIIISDLHHFFNTRHGVKNAYLFGSYAKQTATENSDVDVLTTESIKPRFFELIKDDRVLLYGA